MAGSFFFYFFIFGIALPYTSPVLLELGYSKTEIGLILAALYFLNTTVPILGGRLSDKYFSADKTIRIGAFAMVVTAGALVFIAEGASTWFLVVLLVFGFFRSPMIALQDALAIQVSKNNPQTYSRLRMMGSLGFAVAVTGFGYLIEPFGIRVFFTVLFWACVAFAMQSLVLPKEIKNSLPQVEQGFWRSLNRSWWFWLIAMMCHWTAFGPFNYGFTLLLTEQGISDSATGWIWSLGVAAEFLLFLASGWFFARWRFQTLLLVAFGANLLRWAILVVYPTPWTITLTQLLHGPGFALFYAAALQAISHYSGNSHRASFQGLFSTFVGGVASVIGNALAGALHEHMSFRMMLAWFLPIQVLGIVILLFSPLKPIVTGVNRENEAQLNEE